MRQLLLRGSLAALALPPPPHSVALPLPLPLSLQVGVLTRNLLDDGRGKARALVFRHNHEKETGRSSAVSTEVMGFGAEVDEKGAPLAIAVDSKADRAKVWKQVHDKSDHSVTFIDLCGHEKYLRTTIYGLTGLLPDYGLVLVGANMGVSKMTREHIGIATALGVPFVIAVTKIDIAPPDVYKNTLDNINKILKQARKMPYPVRALKEVDMAAKGALMGRVTPIVCLSNVTGEGLDVLRTLIRALPPRVSGLAGKGAGLLTSHAGPVGGGLGGASSAAASAASAAAEAEADKENTASSAKSATSAAAVVDTEAPGEAMIDSVFNVPGVGTVVAGTVLQGAIKVGATMMLGPDRAGEFQAVVVRSIHVQYCPTEVAIPGRSAAFAIRAKGKLKSGSEKGKGWVRKGMSLVAPELAPTSYFEFTTEVLVLHHQTTMAVGYAPIIHCNCVTQCAQVLGMRNVDTGESIPYLRTGDRAVLHFRFMYRPEFIHPGDQILFREGRAKGVGKVLSVQAPHSHAAAALAAVASSSTVD
jgi:GTPase